VGVGLLPHGRVQRLFSEAKDQFGDPLIVCVQTIDACQCFFAAVRYVV
jgi:hypothetical protein